MRLIDADEFMHRLEEEFDGVGVYDVSGDEVIYDMEQIIDRLPPVNITVPQYCPHCGRTVIGGNIKG